MNEQKEPYYGKSILGKNLLRDEYSPINIYRMDNIRTGRFLNTYYKYKK